MADKTPVTSSRWQKIKREGIQTALLLVGVLAIRSSLASTYVVPTGSMIPTILPGDRFVATKADFGLRLPFTDVHLTSPRPPARGEIVVFPSPVQPEIDLVKRVVAIGGDIVEIRDGRIVLNESPLPTEEAGKDSEGAELLIEKLDGVQHFVRLDPTHPSARYQTKFRVPDGHFFAMGDNRDHSGDSRFFGPVPIEKLRGRARFILFSLDSGTFPYLRATRSGTGLK